MWTTILVCMLTLMAPSQNNVARLREYVIIAKTIEKTCQDDSHCSSVLVAVAHFESGFTIHARGKLGEVGPWQLLGVKPTMKLSEQAKEAWYRWNVQRPEGYTGERTCPCPLAEHRRLEAAMVESTYLRD